MAPVVPSQTQNRTKEQQHNKKQGVAREGWPAAKGGVWLVGELRLFVPLVGGGVKGDGL